MPCVTKQRFCQFASLLVLCTSAAAQMLSPGYALSGAPMSNFLSTSYLTQSVSNDLAKTARTQLSRQTVAQQRLKPDLGQVQGLNAGTAGPPVMPAKLALHYPAAQRAQAQALFEDLLNRYAQVEKQFNIPRGDLPAAVAAFLAGNWMGLHNAEFPDAQFKPVVEQMRSVLAAEPRILAAPQAEKREMYEQMAILGMLMAGTQMGLKQQSNPATERAMRVAARSYLEQFLGTDADRIQMTSMGMVLK